MSLFRLWALAWLVWLGFVLALVEQVLADPILG